MARKERRAIAKHETQSLKEENQALKDDVRDFLHLTLLVNGTLLRCKDKGYLTVPEGSDEEAALIGLISTFNKIFELYFNIQDPSELPEVHIVEEKKQLDQSSE